MSKYKVGDKFVIELAQAYHVRPGEKKAEGEQIVPFTTLFRLKGFSAAAWDDNGLDKLERYREPAEESRLHRYYATRPYQYLLTEPDDLTDAERVRLERIKRIPATERIVKEKLREALRQEVMMLEAKIDAISDYLEGFME